MKVIPTIESVLNNPVNLFVFRPGKGRQWSLNNDVLQLLWWNQTHHSRKGRFETIRCDQSRRDEMKFFSRDPVSGGLTAVLHNNRIDDDRFAGPETVNAPYTLLHVHRIQGTSM